MEKEKQDVAVPVWLRGDWLQERELTVCPICVFPSVDLSFMWFQMLIRVILQ